MVGVAESNNPNAREAGETVTRAALEALSADGSDAGASAPGLAIVFAGGQLDAEQLLVGIRSVLPATPVVGGAAVGAMTHRAIGSTGYECAIALLPGDLGEAQIVADGDLTSGERDAGYRIGARLREVASNQSAVLLFYDSVKSSPPPELHIASQLLAGLNEGLADRSPTIVGGGMLVDLELSDSYVFDGTGIARHTAVAVVLPTGLVASTTIIHGCEPISSFLEVTRVDGAVVHELDGKPAAAVLAERLGIDVDTLARFDQSLAITLGAKQGDPFAPFDESNYVNRMLVSVDAVSGSVTLFEADFEVGARVQIMTTSVERMNESAMTRTQGLFTGEATLAAGTALFGLYIDCAGRSPAFCGADAEEADIVRERVGDHCPMVGFYSGVEIAPVHGKARPLDWTGVLAVFHADTAASVPLA